MFLILISKQFLKIFEKILVLLYISKKNNLDYLEDLSSFFELMKAVSY